VTIPPGYLSFLRPLTRREVPFGSGGISLLQESDLGNSGQVGYSVSPDGLPLADAREGGWRESWVVVGHDLAVGDPLILDTGSPSLPILTSAHGEGSWEPQLVSSNLASFGRLLAAFEQIAEGRSNPADLAKHPPTGLEIDRYLRAALAEEKASGAYLFWDMLLEDYSRFMGEAPEEMAGL